MTVVLPAHSHLMGHPFALTVHRGGMELSISQAQAKRLVLVLVKLADTVKEVLRRKIAMVLVQLDRSVLSSKMPTMSMLEELLQCAVCAMQANFPTRLDHLVANHATLENIQ